ncbi:uncharacterized protein LOC120402963 [Mauremys reevesii]|uniref:uncharacterized protein LOC120402963 n=1 Tax=Mauremys reevesii TaxID=260615 RepID=UPI00193F99F3|nr:uncharacterized protein LOC120402963 [Mauremys reevesii]
MSQQQGRRRRVYWAWCGRKVNRNSLSPTRLLALCAVHRSLDSSDQSEDWLKLWYCVPQQGASDVSASPQMKPFMLLTLAFTSIESLHASRVGNPQSHSSKCSGLYVILPFQTSQDENTLCIYISFGNSPLLQYTQQILSPSHHPSEGRGLDETPSVALRSHSEDSTRPQDILPRETTQKGMSSGPYCNAASAYNIHYWVFETAAAFHDNLWPQ